MIFSIVTVLGIFGFTIINAHKRLDIEKGKTPLYSSTAGGQIGWLNYKGPFISLRIYEDFLVIVYTKTIVLRFDEIDQVEIKKWIGLVSDRIQIVHHKLNVPSKIIIGTSNPAKVKELIESKLLPEM